MSDFDKFFKEKLDEEGQFPRRDKNWKMLSKRLDAFQTGLQQQGTTARTYLRYWQAAAVFAVVTTGLLTWKVVATQSENAELRQEVAVLREKNKAQELEIATQKTFTPPLGEQNGQASSNRFFEEKEKYFHSNNISAYRNNLYSNAPVAQGANILKTTNYEEKRPSGEKVATADSSQVQTADLTKVSKWPNLEMLPANDLDGVSSQSKTTLKVAPLAKEKSVAATPNLIKPVRQPSRFRAGVQFSTGFPQPSEAGVSPLIGPGVAGEFNVWRDLWLTASADWLRFDVSTEKYFPKFHSHHQQPDPPHHGGGSPPSELVKVESTQRQQQYGLGVRYALPVRFWVRPSMRVAHTWTHISSELISFTFEKPLHGPPHGGHDPEFIVEKTKPQTLDNTWRFGLGLERETPSWAFGLWADYSKSFAANAPSFDMLLLRAGIQYRFN
ncbi:MAG: hypothetical protein OHK0019_00960 [Saprospiraceae bacterium]